MVPNTSKRNPAPWLRWDLVEEALGCSQAGVARESAVGLEETEEAKVLQDRRAWLVAEASMLTPKARTVEI